MILRNAGGSLLKIHGQADRTLNIGNYAFEFSIKVVSLGEKSAILGLDFMETEDVALWLKQGVMQIGDNEDYWVRLHKLNSDKCAKITVDKEWSIPPNHELLISGKINSRQTHFEEAVGTVEQTDSLPEKTGLFVANTLVSTASTHIPVRVANFNNNTVTLNKGQTIAMLHPVYSDMIHELDDISETEGNVNQVTESENDDSGHELPAHLQPLIDNLSSEGTESERKQLTELIYKYKDSFMGPDGKLGRTNLLKHRIDTGNTRPIKQRLRIPPIHMQDAVDKEVDRLLGQGIIEPSESPWSSPLLAVKKKNGEIRLCADLRKLNAALVNTDAYPLPKIDECLDTLSGSQFFSTLDLASGYHQVPLHEDDKEKTAFSTRKGHFHYTAMPFGLANSPSSFERLMEICLRGLQWKVACLYLDDVSSIYF